MKNVNTNEQILVNGGATHFHGICRACKYKTGKMTKKGALAWVKSHNKQEHKGKNIAYAYSCSGKY